MIKCDLRSINATTLWVYFIFLFEQPAQIRFSTILKFPAGLFAVNQLPTSSYHWLDFSTYRFTITTYFLQRYCVNMHVYVEVLLLSLMTQDLKNVSPQACWRSENLFSRYLKLSPYLLTNRTSIHLFNDDNSMMTVFNLSTLYTRIQRSVTPQLLNSDRDGDSISSHGRQG